MNKLFVAITAALCMTVPAHSQINGDGYYRVQNYATGRYVSIIHNTSHTEYVTTQADLNALRTFKQWSKVESDPSTIIYFKEVGSGTLNGKTYKTYDLYGQGTNTYSIINYHVGVIDVSGKYRCFVIYEGTQYLSEKSAPSTDDVNHLYIGNSATYNWNVKPLSSSSDNYFGVKPTVTSGGKYYATMYSDFGFKPAATSKDMKAYYVDRIWNGNVVVREIEGDVPAYTPVIFECSSLNASDNKLDIAKNNAKLPSDNQLTGVFFCIDNGQSFHKDFVAYDPETMRVLGECSDGRIGFVQKTAADFPSEYPLFIPKGAIPANTAYLKVPAGSPAELPLMSYEEYTSGITGVEADKTTASDVVSLSGVTVRKNAVSLDGLPSGVYIWNKKKIVID